MNGTVWCVIFERGERRRGNAPQGRKEMRSRAGHNSERHAQSVRHAHRQQQDADVNSRNSRILRKRNSQADNLQVSAKRSVSALKDKPRDSRADIGVSIPPREKTEIVTNPCKENAQLAAKSRRLGIYRIEKHSAHNEPCCAAKWGFSANFVKKSGEKEWEPPLFSRRCSAAFQPGKPKNEFGFK
ncbi:hypothetical protein RQN30_09765 [Arcanobacterium hippocoleae]